MKLKQVLVCLMVLCALALAFQLTSAESPNGAAPAGQAAPVRITSLKGPTSMGLVKLIMDEQAKQDYTFQVAGTADEIVPLLVKGDLDIALIPCNLASVLYNRLDGNLYMTAINTLGVLYIVEDGDSVQSVQDLWGKTLFSTGKGTTPEYALNYVLDRNGVDPANDLNIEYKSEATEVAAALNSGATKLAMLPQPYVTAVLAQNPNLRVALSLSDEWDKVSNGESALVTGVVVARKEFAEQHPETLKAFMAAYATSTQYINEHPSEVAPAIEELGIAKAAIAERAIPNCNIVCITGDDMKTKAAGYLGALFAQDPTAVGGKLPDEAFYYQAQ